MDSFVLGNTVKAKIKFTSLAAVNWEGTNPSMLQICGSPDTIFGLHLYSMISGGSIDPED